MKLIKFYRPDLYGYKALANQGFWCNPPSETNDPFEGFIDVETSIEYFIPRFREGLEDYPTEKAREVAQWTDYEISEYIKMGIEKIKKKYAFCALSKINCREEMIMWAHYASSHQGFALEFEFAEDRKITYPSMSEAVICGILSIRPDKVNYSDLRESIELDYLFQLVAGKNFVEDMPGDLMAPLLLPGFLRAYSTKHKSWK